MIADTAKYWNHNVHYQSLVVDAVPAGCQAALDVGCGDGLLACKLADRCAAVTGIDRDGPMIAAARERARQGTTSPDGTTSLMSPPPEFIEADFMTYPFAAGSYDFVCANTSLHHMDFGAALAQMAWLLRPGGRLVAVGLGDHGSPADWLIDVIGIPVNLYYKLTRTEGNSGAPVMAPGMTWGQARATARNVLPGVRYRRHLLWRYSLQWTKPA
ncbi:MAG TPA: class I SAM-dependent methyltransferase [Trebonia sp.]|nr:class I SAM-dependent methyltransferase [Trebonia sp.]